MIRSTDQTHMRSAEPMSRSLLNIQGDENLHFLDEVLKPAKSSSHLHPRPGSAPILLRWDPEKSVPSFLLFPEDSPDGGGHTFESRFRPIVPDEDDSIGTGSITTSDKDEIRFYLPFRPTSREANENQENVGGSAADKGWAERKYHFDPDEGFTKDASKVRSPQTSLATGTTITNTEPTMGKYEIETSTPTLNVVKKKTRGDSCKHLNEGSSQVTTRRESI